MILQFKILLFLLCINVVAYVVLNAQTGGAYIFPGVHYAAPLNETGSLSDLESNFNGTSAVETWTPVGGLGFAGDIYSALNMFWSSFRFLIDGLGMTIEWVGSVVPAGTVIAFAGQSLSMFEIIAWVFRIIGGVIFLTLVIEFVSGRQLME